MKSRIVSISILAFLLTMLASSFTQVGSSYYGTVTETSMPPSIAWNMKVGDEFSYIFNSSAIIAADPSIWPAIDNYMIANLGYPSTFSSQSIATRALNALPKNLGVKFTITAITGKFIQDKWNNGNISYYATYNRDSINVSLEIRQTLDGEWEKPNTYFADVVEQFFRIEYELANYTTNPNYESYIAQMRTMILGQDFSNFEMSRWNSNLQTNYTYRYYDYGSDIVNMFDNSNIDYHNPADKPFTFASQYGPLSYLTLPNDYNVLGLYNYLIESYQYNFNYEKAKGYSTGPYATEDFEETLQNMGCSITKVLPKAISFTQDLSKINSSQIWAPWIFGNLSMMGINSPFNTLHLGIEYENQTGMLNALGAYFDGNCLLNLTQYGIPSVLNKPVSVNASMTLTRLGATPITKENIMNGEIGEDRNGSLFGLPGYDLFLVGLAGFITVVTTIIKYKRRNL